MSLTSLRRLYAKRSPIAPVTPRAQAKLSRPEVDRPTMDIRNSFCDLLGFPQKAIDAVRTALTYKNESIAMEKTRIFRMMAMAKSRGNRGLLFKMKARLSEIDGQEWVCWLSSDNQFPTGHLSIVRTTLANAGFEFIEQEHRVIPTPSHTFRWNNRPPTLRYYQTEMVALAKEHSRGVFEAAVGTGKSRVITEIIKDLEVTTLIVVPSSPLVVQLGNTLEQAFGRKHLSTVTTAAIKKGTPLKPIRITTVQTLAALQKKDLLSAVLEGVDMIIIDEIHHAGSKTYTDLLPELDHIYYRFGFTGTFMRNDAKTLDMWGFLSQKLFSYPAWKATSEGYLTPLEFYIHSLQGRGSHKYPTEYNNNYCGGEPLLEEIEQIMRQTDEHEQVLILVDRKDDAGKVIHEYLTGCGIGNAYISGDDKKAEIQACIEGFNAKEIRVLIGSTVIGEGVDVYATDRLILARGGKSEIAIVQAIGRAVRLAEGKSKAIVHDFSFENTKFLKKHLDQRLEIYKNSFGGEIIFL